MLLGNRPSVGVAGADIIAAGCTATEQVGDAVYVLSAGQVRQADAGSSTTSRVVGFIAVKPSATTCQVVTNGQFDGLGSLTSGATYFLSTTPGAITTTPPTGESEVIVQVGEALDATTLLVRPDSEMQI